MTLTTTNSNCRTKCYTFKDMEMLNLLQVPIWVFDIENKCMWWANKAGVHLWNADSLEALLSRNFSDDMSEATERRLAGYMEQFRRGESCKESWTYYPGGKGPVTVEVNLSGILIDEGRMVMLNEGNPLKSDEIDNAALRGVEMLRHLPVSVCQFDIEGNLMHQNPESLAVFGTPPKGDDVDDKRVDDDTGSNKRRKRENNFQRQFVDTELGKRAFEEVAKNGNDYCGEAQQHTKMGIRWFAIKVRRAKDPVTAKPVILYSARDITDVIEAKKEADEANQQKSEFLAVMAHEIRTPLHQVVGTIELLSRSYLNVEQTEYVNVLQTATLSLMAIINDLLDYTKLEAGKMDLEKVPFDAKGVVDGTLSIIRAKVEEKGLALETSIVDDMPKKVLGDPNRLRQILLNLLNNAVKFTHKGTIKLSVESIQRNNGNDDSNRTVLRFSVQDTGIGICPEHQAHIFRKYKQADASVSKNYGGTGLGLAICESLCHAMTGKIGLQSEVGKGSTFWLELPFALASNGLRKKSPSPDTILSNLSIRSDNQQQKYLNGVEPSSISNLKVLVAEDNKVNQKVVAAMLRRMGHSVTIVDNGQKAVDRLDCDTFDVVLMDVQMPVLDGIEATKQIRIRGSRCPVIGLTASFQRGQIQFYQDAGMNDCISKPVLMKDLKSTITRSVLGNKVY